MTYKTLKYALGDGVATITLNRPDQLNAFTVEMAEELIEAFTSVSADDGVRAVILTGEGRAFCAGMDLSSSGNVFGLNEDLRPSLKDMRDRLDDPEIIAGVRDTGGRVTLAMYECRKPIIAAINGAAVGIGATMTLAADFRLACDRARIGFVFGKLGIVPEACSTWFLPRLVGLQQAMEWIYSADILSAEEALRGGLVRSLHPAAQLIAAARELADRITRDRSPVATALMRQMLLRNSAQPHPLEAHRIDSLAMFYTSVGDGKEGVAAFLEKRSPAFVGKASELPDFYPWW